ncbi:MAG: hypothetical protein LUG60_06115 [Erysipelotrichaceae bacterium]|nr:hypothetical protein [Erysipelotrichaceae bacterium]
MKGTGTIRDVYKGFYWIEKAAQNGNIDAMRNISICYDEGIGTNVNKKLARYWRKMWKKSL